MNKILKLFGVMSFLLLACSAQKQKVKAIAAIDILWDDEYSMVIGSSKKNIEDVITNKKVYVNLQEAKQFIRSKAVISDNALQYLAAFLLEQDRSKFPEISDARPVYNLKVITETNIYNCYYYSGEKNFESSFIELKQWLTKSPYSQEYGFFYKYIDGAVRSARRE